jgi:hypothetical protein
MDSRVISGAESSGSNGNANNNGQKHKGGVHHNIPPTIMPNAPGTGEMSPGQQQQQQRRTDAISNSEQRRASLLPLDKRLAKHQNSQDEAMTDATNKSSGGSPALLQDVGLPLQRMDLNDSPTKSPPCNLPSAFIANRMLILCEAISPTVEPKTSQRPTSSFGSGGGGFKKMVDWRSFFAVVDRSYRTKSPTCPSVRPSFLLQS